MKKIMNIGLWLKKHILISIIGVGVVGGAVAAPIIVHNVNENNKFKIELNDDLNYELDSDVFLLSIIKKVSNGELITENKKIDTSKLGEQEIKIKYIDNKKKKHEYKFKIKIVDTTKPTIEYQKELTTIIGTDIDLLKDVKVNDNSKEEIKASVEGEYDINKIGTYNLKYVAIDNSNNKVEEEFVLTVRNMTFNTSGYYVATSGTFGYGSIKFYDDNKFDLWASFGDYGAATAYQGTYKINDNNVIFYANKTMDMPGWIDCNETFNFIIIDENTIKYGAYTYKWQSTSNLSSKHPKNL